MNIFPLEIPEIASSRFLEQSLYMCSICNRVYIYIHKVSKSMTLCIAYVRTQHFMQQRFSSLCKKNDVIYVDSPNFCINPKLTGSSTPADTGGVGRNFCSTCQISSGAACFQWTSNGLHSGKITSSIIHHIYPYRLSVL